MTEDQEIVEKIREVLMTGKKYGRMKVSNDFNISETVARRLANLAKSSIPVEDIKEPDIKKQVKPKRGLTMDEIRAKYDNMFIVHKKADLLQKQVFLTQSEFADTCSFSGAGYRNTLEKPEFSKFKGKAGGTIYWGHPDSIKQLKEESVLKDV